MTITTRSEQRCFGGTQGFYSHAASSTGTDMRFSVFVPPHAEMECFPGIDITPMFDVLRRCMSERTHDGMENALRFEDGSVGWFDLRLVPVPQVREPLTSFATDASSDPSPGIESATSRSRSAPRPAGSNFAVVPVGISITALTEPSALRAG